MGTQGATGAGGATGATGVQTPWATTIDAANHQLENLDTATFDQEYDNGSSGAGTVTVDWNNGQKQLLTLTGNCTIAFTNPPGPGNFLLRLVQGGGGGFSPTWPAQGVSAGDIAWANKTVITLTATAGGIDIVGFYFNGSLYFASYNNNFG